MAKKNEIQKGKTPIKKAKKLLKKGLGENKKINKKRKLLTSERNPPLKEKVVKKNIGL